MCLAASCSKDYEPDYTSSIYSYVPNNAASVTCKEHNVLFVRHGIP